jgi:ribonuclease J
MVSITVHGGAGEIGGNKILVEDGDHRVFLDFGMSFGKIGDFYEDFLQPRTNSGLRDLLALGILPKIDGIYRDDLLELDHLRETLDDLGVADSSLWAAEVKSYKDIKERDGRPALDGVIVSHAHMDHFQHISMLDESIPVFCSETTKAVIEAAEDLSADRFGTDVINVKRRSIAKQGKSAYFPDTPKVNSECIPRPVNAVCPERAFAVGAMDAELHPVDHSVPGATAVVLKTGGKRIVYTGDLRFHGLAGDLTRRFRDSLAGSRPDVLIAEGTRIEKDTPDSEAGVLEECARLVSQAGPALAMVGFAWKDTTRYRTMMEVARETGRTLVVSAKLAYLTNKLSSLPDAPVRPVCDEPDVKVYLKRKGSMLYSMSDYVGTKYDLGYSTGGTRRLLDHRHPTLRVRRQGIRHRRRPGPLPPAPRLLRAQRAHRPAPPSRQCVRERGQRAVQHGDGARQRPPAALAPAVRGEPAGLRADVRPRLRARQRAGGLGHDQTDQPQGPHPGAHRTSRTLRPGAGRQRHRRPRSHGGTTSRPALGSESMGGNCVLRDESRSFGQSSALVRS